MFSWILVLILIVGGEPQIQKVDSFEAMDTCFKMRETAMTMINKPIVNYQLVCIQQKESEKPSGFIY